ncbi:MAG: hypothetical protein LWY06_12420 [Firmicutes bacterium]|nr:hypothetical protein [Bacillota bacterium]
MITNRNPVIQGAAPQGENQISPREAGMASNPMEQAIIVILQRMDKISNTLDRLLADTEKTQIQDKPQAPANPVIPEEIKKADKTDAVTPDGNTGKTEKLPPFIRAAFTDELGSRPAEAMLNLIADIHQGKPELTNAKAAQTPDFLGMISKISRQVRKDRLTEKFADAGEMISDIEALFKEIPEIEMRPDAYEIAYKLVKGKIGEAMPSAKETTKKDKEPDLKEKAFVESSKGASTGSSGTELTPVQREICAKLGISENTFRKYMK